jgi:hypothetical protein
MRVCFAILIVLLVFPCLAAADTIYMKDGSTIEGQVVSMDETTIKVTLPYGTLTITRQDVKRIDFGIAGQEAQKKEEQKKEEPKEVVPAITEKPQPAPEPKKEPVVKIKSKKNPTTATMLAVIPGGGYAYLGRADLALAAIAAEVGLTAGGMSMLQDEDEGNNSTGNALLGFAVLIKIAEMVDTHDRAVSRNKSLSLELVPGGVSVCLAAAVRF